MKENIQDVPGYIGDEAGQTIVSAKAVRRVRNARRMPMRRRLESQEPRIMEGVDE